MNKEWFDDRIIIDGYDIWCCIKGLISWLHNCLQNIAYKKKKKGTEQYPCWNTLFLEESCTAHKTDGPLFKLARAEMSVLLLQAIVMNGQHLVESPSLPLPSRPSWLLVSSSSTLTGCLMEVALRQKRQFYWIKCCSFTEDLSSNHCWRPLRPSFIAGGWSELPMVT